MKISKLSLILLSGLLVCQGTIPMENPTNSALKKAQKAGKIALRIGAGTATLGIYAFMGTAALASWGITLGAAALSLARYLKPKATTPQAPKAPEIPEIKAKNTPNQSVKKPSVAPTQPVKKAPKNRASLYTKTALRAASAGVVAAENDILDTENIHLNRETREQALQRMAAASAVLQAQLDECNAQAIEWRKQHNNVRIAEFPRYEGPYQDMIGVIDGDVEELGNYARTQMNEKLEYNWQQSGCKNRQDQMETLARKIKQDSMRLPKL